MLFWCLVVLMVIFTLSGIIGAPLFILAKLRGRTKKGWAWPLLPLGVLAVGLAIGLYLNWVINDLLHFLDWMGK